MVPAIGGISATRHLHRSAAGAGGPHGNRPRSNPGNRGVSCGLRCVFGPIGIAMRFRTVLATCGHAVFPGDLRESKPAMKQKAVRFHQQRSALLDVATDLSLQFVEPGVDRVPREPQGGTLEGGFIAKQNAVVGAEHVACDGNPQLRRLEVRQELRAQHFKMVRIVVRHGDAPSVRHAAFPDTWPGPAGQSRRPLRHRSA